MPGSSSIDKLFEMLPVLAAGTTGKAETVFNTIRAKKAGKQSRKEENTRTAVGEMLELAQANQGQVQPKDLVGIANKYDVDPDSLMKAMTNFMSYREASRQSQTGDRVRGLIADRPGALAPRGDQIDFNDKLRQLGVSPESTGGQSVGPVEVTDILPGVGRTTHSTMTPNEAVGEGIRRMLGNFSPEKKETFKATGYHKQTGASRAFTNKAEYDAAIANGEGEYSQINFKPIGMTKDGKDKTARSMTQYNFMKDEGYTEGKADADTSAKDALDAAKLRDKAAADAVKQKEKDATDAYRLAASSLTAMGAEGENVGLEDQASMTKMTTLIRDSDPGSTLIDAHTRAVRAWPILKRLQKKRSKEDIDKLLDLGIPIENLRNLLVEGAGMTLPQIEALLGADPKYGISGGEQRFPIRNQPGAGGAAGDSEVLQEYMRRREAGESPEQIGQSLGIR